MTWESLTQQRWLTSDKLAPWQNRILLEMKANLPSDPAALWILSSGTQSVNQVKAIELSHAALLASAASVNQHLKVVKEDRWLLTLPHYHVGGLGILARAHLSGSLVFQMGKWSVADFVAAVTEHNISLVSLVPTQVFDLVSGGLRAPGSLRAIVVGGGSLDPSLYSRARELGWPVLPSYGLTECCSQVATGSLSSLDEKGYPGLEILPHVQVEVREGRLFIKSIALATSVAVGTADGSVLREDPKQDGWLPTEDLGEVNGSELKVLGRRDEVVKVLGTLVPLAQVEHDAREFFRGIGGNIAVVAIPGGREENTLVLVTDAMSALGVWEMRRAEYNSRAAGPMRLKQLCWVPALPLGELGKVKRGELTALLNAR